jgi:hypothetical protein
MTKLTFSRLLESRTGVGDRIQEGSRNKAEAQSRKSEQQTRNHVAAPTQMKIIPYLSRIFVCLPTLCFQTKSKTKSDPRTVGSSRTQEQLWPPSSVFPIRSPGDQLHVVALRPTDSRELE